MSSSLVQFLLAGARRGMHPLVNRLSARLLISSRIISGFGVISTRVVGVGVYDGILKDSGS